MRLASIRINNLRCLSNCEVTLREFTSLIGPNNCGKSTVLRAIDLFVNQTKPAPEEWRQGYKEQPITIEGCFEDIQDWERNSPGVAGIVHNNRIRLRLTAKCDENGSVKTEYEAYVRDTNITGWNDRWSDLGEQIKQIATVNGITNGNQWRTVASKEQIRQIICDQHPTLVEYGEERWTSENISIAPALKQAIPQATYIPAVRDASEDAKPSARSPFGLLLSKIVLPAITGSAEYTDFMHAVNALTTKISGVGGEQLPQIKKLADELSASVSAIIKAKVLVTLQSPDADKFLGSNATIRIDDGVETPIYLQGHGAQRALIFALIDALARRTATTDESKQSNERSVILLFEEPELYMHPHLIRRLQNALQQIAKSRNWQVVITTHSPFMIDVANDPRSLVIFRRESSQQPPTLSQLYEDPFETDNRSRRDRDALRAALDFHPTVTEAFFARRVVLVEGDTEVAVLRQEKRLLPLVRIDQIQSDYVTIVSCGGKWTILAMAKLLQQFQIPFRIVHDCDKQGKCDEELQQLNPIHPYHANERIREIVHKSHIYMVEDTFEDVLWPDESRRSSRDKPFAAWKHVNDLCNSTQDLNHLPKLREIIDFVFNW